MLKRAWYFVPALISFLLIFSGCGGQETPPPATAEEFSRRAMLENIAHEIILPLHEDFSRQTEALRAAVRTFQATPTLENLQSLQEAWRATSRLWYKVTLFRLGRLTFSPQSRIANNVPLATPLIDQFIDGTDPLDTDALAVFGSNVVGLRAVEYLIFDPEGGNESVIRKYTDDPTAARRAQYLVLTTEDLNATVSELLQVWLPEGSNYVEAFVDGDDPSSVQGSISMLANQMMSTLESTITMMIGWPLGILSGSVQVDIIESKYSGYTLQQVKSNIENLRDTFNGRGASEDGFGFDDYLDFLGAAYNDMSLADAINQQFDRVIAALNAIEEPFAVALVNNPQQVQRVYDEGRSLIVLLKTDMASRLGITITYNDSDGD